MQMALKQLDRGRATIAGVAVDELVRELLRRTGAEVRFDDGTRAMYAVDGSNYRQVPIGVVIPRTVDDVIETVAICRQFDAPLLSRGGGTSLAGQCCNVAVVMDYSKYLNEVIEIDPRRKIARAQPGIILDHLNHACSRHELMFGPDPATHQYCTLGGTIGNNACGVHSVFIGTTADNVEEMEILTYDGCRMRVGQTSDEELKAIIRTGGRRGDIYRRLKELRDRYANLIRARFRDIPRHVSGYNLDQLLPENGFQVARALVGTEGTCVNIVDATVRLVYSHPHRALVVLGYPSIYEAADHIMEIRQLKPVGLEGMDDVLVGGEKQKGLNPKAMPLLPDGGGWLLVEFGGRDMDEAEANARGLVEKLKKSQNPPQMKLYTDRRQRQLIWEIRESGLGGTAYVPGRKLNWEGWEDAAVPPEKLGGYLREFRDLLNRYKYTGPLYGHFGDGCVHARIDFDLFTGKGIRTFRSFIEEAADLVVKYGGSLSGEHGDGQSRAELLPKMFGPELIAAFREFKSIWDPQGKMNPGKVVDPHSITSNLKLGPEYQPRKVETYFRYPQDHGSLADATLRCVGVGKCRRMESGTMCPSFMVTREEKHTTRGRARLLWEMMRGEVITDGWQSEEVREALDLCLSCKGCKGDCPVNVDVATYKAEFLAHYYQHHRRPRHAYAFGLIIWWARLASTAPTLFNFVSQTPILRNLAKLLAGIPQKRTIPPFAPQTFKQWFDSKPRSERSEDADKTPVLLFPDTFNNHFHPDILRAALEVLEHAGFKVDVPRRFLCCGRPLYDFGFLEHAQYRLRRILEILRPQIRAGVPIVMLEPSCASVFRDELINFFPDDEDAQRLREQVCTLAQFLLEKAPHLKLPKLEGRAILHGHCHQKALMSMEADMEVLKRLGLEVELLDSGCCGMAGPFGFEKQHYDVSVACGERVLLPRVRQADERTVIITDGFSCQEQIAQLTDRHALHIAQVLQMALRQEPRKTRPESSIVRNRCLARRRAGTRAAAAIAAGIAIGAAIVLAGRRRTLRVQHSRPRLWCGFLVVRRLLSIR